MDQLQQALQQLTQGQQPEQQQAPGFTPGQSDGSAAPTPQQHPLNNMTMEQMMTELTSPPAGKYQPLAQSQLPGHSPQGPATEQFTNGQHPIESTAFGQAVASGADPSVLAHMAGSLNTNQFIGLCEAFVEQATKGQQGIYSSANAAWQAQQSVAQKDMAKIKAGDVVYFAPDQSNGNYGHTGVYVGNNQFVSATYNGVKQYNLDDWKNATGQKLLGFVPKNAMATVGPQHVQQPQQFAAAKPQQQQLAQHPMQQPKPVQPAQAHPAVQQKPNLFGSIGGAISHLL